MGNKDDFNKPIRWGIIGCGNVTEIKSGPAFKRTEGFELSAVMRRDVNKLKDYAKRHEVAKYYTDADALIEDDEIDAIYIATPPNTHLYYALKVAESGKPCCVEKPLAPSYADSLAIYESFITKGIPLFVAYYRRSLPRFMQIESWLKNNEIGEIRHISWNLCKPPNNLDLTRAYNWRTDNNIAKGGYFDDLASHGIDLFTYLLGDIINVSGISTNQQQLYAAKDAVSACWLHEGGITGSGYWNFGCSHYEDQVEILGSLGKIQFSIYKENPLLLYRKDSKQEVFIENPENVHVFHVENMRRQLFDTDFIHPSNGQTATHTSWVMDKILGQNI